jgi:hypothetical protein
MARKTPIRLSRAPITGRVMVLTRYSVIERNGREVFKAALDGKHDVTADFDSLMLDELMADDAPDMVAILDGVAGGHELSDNQRRQVSSFERRLRAACERHNARVSERRGS